MAGCVFAEAVENGWVAKPELYFEGECRGGSGCADCCEKTAIEIDPTKKAQTVAQALKDARRTEVAGIYLGVLNAVNVIEQQTGQRII